MLTVSQIKAGLSSLSVQDIVELQKTINNMLNNQQQINNKNVLSSELQNIFLKCTSHRSEVFCCPYCGSITVVRNGRRNGRQRYLCKDCRKTFGDTYGTFFYHCKLSFQQLKEFIYMTLHNYSLNEIVAEMQEKDLKINRATAWYNRHKLCEMIVQTEGEQDNFQAVTEADEFYTPLSFIGERNPVFFLETLGRTPNHNRNKAERYQYAETAGYSIEHIKSVQGFYSKKDEKSALSISNELNSISDKTKVNKILQSLDTKQLKKRGISNQQVCVLSCMDLVDNLYISPVCIGRLEPRHLENSIKAKFNENSILVTDSHRAYKTFANKHKIHLRQIPPDKHTSGPYNLAKLNSCHSRLTDFMKKYKEVASKYIDHYLALFRWQEKHKKEQIKNKVNMLIDMQTMCMNRENTGCHTFKNRAMPFDTKGLFHN